MLKLFNTFGKKREPFKPANRKVVNLFTCGPSVYQRSHIGNFRTFLFEDILVRYLEYKGHRVVRGMNVTDVEDKAIEEAEKKGMTLRRLTQQNIDHFLREMNLLRMKRPEYLPRASEAIDEAVEIIQRLLHRGVAYWHGGNVYFDPLKYPRFGELYGLDMRRWPKKKRRFHKDTYPGMRWNLGDFILWHGEGKAGTVRWDTRIGRGRPSWNIQDPSLIFKCCQETLSIYCGGIDNLYRHHDYSRAVLESIRPYPMARYWLHSEHLVVNGQKMSKSLGNIIYTDDLIKERYRPEEIRFFLIYGHYREKQNYSAAAFRSAAERWKEFSRAVKKLGGKSSETIEPDREAGQRLKTLFEKNMDDDLDVRGAFDALSDELLKRDPKNIKPRVASGLVLALKEIDQVLCIMNLAKDG
jgi:cysteinyl-tRNA synthetase